jgi:hypothetical protein
MNVAQNILQQLGGNRFLAMTGARGLVNHGDALSMQLPRNHSGANRLTIKLDANDTYSVRFWKLRNYQAVDVVEHDGIYCDMLQRIFTQVTGFDTNMGAIIRR